MGTWIEVRVRYEKMQPNGTLKKVTEPYLVDALSCTEAEARVTKELEPYIGGDFRITSVVSTKISEIFWDMSGDRFYKVKVNFITIDAKTGAEKKISNYILVQASSFARALAGFEEGMKGTMADYEIEGINETKIIEVYQSLLYPTIPLKERIKEEVEKALPDCEVDVIVHPDAIPPQSDKPNDTDNPG